MTIDEYKMLLSVPGAFLITDSVCCSILASNECFHELTGLTFDDTAKIKLENLNIWRDKKFQIDFIAEVLEKGSLNNRETFIIHNGGKAGIYFLSASKVSLTDCDVFVFTVNFKSTVKQELGDTLDLQGEVQKLTHLGYWTLEHSANELIWTDEIFRIFGVDKESFTPSYKNFLRFIYPDDVKVVRAAFSDSVKNRKSYDITHRVLLRNNEIKYVHERGRTLYDENGNSVRSFGTVQDVTKQKMTEKALEENKNMFRAFVGHSIEAMYMHDITGTIMEVNETAVYDSGYSRTELLNKNIFEIVPDLKKITNNNLWESLSPFENKLFSAEQIRKNGTVYPVDIRGSKIVLNDMEYLLTLAQNISAQKAAENDRERYTYMISHDLKEPIRTIRVFSELIMDDYNTLLNEELGDYFNRIKKSSSKMAVMIDDLLLLSQVGKKNVYLKQCNVRQIIDDFTITYEKMIMKNNVELIISDLPQIKCQPAWLYIIFQDIIINSIKFNKSKHKKVEIAYNEQNEFHEFIVKDNGVGIEKELWSKIFGLFRKGHQNKNIEGVGSGLAIAASIVEEHNGEIWISESTINKGTCVNFTIHKNL